MKNDKSVIPGSFLTSYKESLQTTTFLERDNAYQSLKTKKKVVQIRVKKIADQVQTNFQENSYKQLDLMSRLEGKLI